MRNKLVRWLSGAAVVASLVTFAGFASAGFGSGGSYGGSYGGYAASYGSSGGLGYGGSTGYGGGSSGGNYYAGYGSSGVASYGGSSGGGSYGGHVGPIRRLHNHIHSGIHNRAAARIAARSYGSSGGSSGVVYSSSYGSSGGFSYGSSGGAGYGSSGGSSYISGGSSGGSYYAPSQSYGSSGGVSYSSVSYGGGSTGGYAPAYSSGSSGSAVQYGSYDHVPSYNSGMEGTAIGHSSTPMSNNSFGTVHNASKLATSKSVDPREIHLIVNLPEEAKVFVNGNPTTSTGATRHFISRNLSEGESYRFELKAVMADANGQEIEKTKTLVLNSGNGEEINFDMRSNDEVSETVLTLNVPEDASVVLANNVTKTSGASRIYRTKQLRNGETWDDYKIQVTVAGVTKEKVIRLIGGDNLELTFNFDNPSDEKLAMK